MNFKKLYQILDRRYKIKVFFLMGFMLIGMVIETLSVAAVIPAVGLMSGDDFVSKYPSIAKFIDLSHYSTKSIVTFAMTALVSIYFIKFIVLSLLAWTQSKILFGIQANISSRMFQRYMYQPFTFHLQNNSAQLIRNVINETNVMTSALSSIFILITELFVILGIGLLLFYYQPMVSILILVSLTVATLGFHRLTKSYILRWGKLRQYYEGLRIQHVQQGLGGIKEFKLLGRESELVDGYGVHNNNNARVNQYQNFIQQIPRLVLEFISIACAALVAIIVINQSQSAGSMLPIMALFLAAAFRILPSVNRVINGMQNARFVIPVIDMLSRELGKYEFAPPQKTEANFPLISKITFDHVTYKYNNADVSAIKKVHLVIPIGSSVGFVGGSGAGKSTLICLLSGLLSPDEGKILVDDSDISTDLRGWQHQIGYVPQSIFLTDDTLRRNIAFGLPDNEIDEEALQNAIRSAQLEDFVNSQPYGLDTLVGERGVRISGGQCQRIGIARALYHNPQVLILDEATSSLDIFTEKEVMESIKALKGKKTIIIVAHRLTTVEHCDKLFRFENGVLVEEGSTQTILASIRN